MSGIKDNEHIDDLRNRLYQRGTAGVGNVHHDLTDEPVAVPTDWDERATPEEVLGMGAVPVQDAVPETYEPAIEAITMRKKKQRSYRVVLALLGLGFFAFAMILSSMFLVFNRGGISGDNIALVLTMPFTIGGGEVLPIQVGVRNDNSVPIESATLIIEYPPGTKSVDENPRDLFTERISLDTISPGDTLNLPIRISVFGEENEEKTIRASIEYRVQGSSARFFKEAEPQTLKIGSAPVSLRVDGLRRISAGQEISLTLNVVSNSLTPVSEVLVRAEYPSGFEFRRATPEPVSGQNTWLVPDVNPETSHSITIVGVINGQNTDQNVMRFNVGIPNDRDKNSFASVFGSASTEFEIEEAFLNIDVRVAEKTDQVVPVNFAETAQVSINLENTLEYSLYDLRLVATMSGNGFISEGVRSTSGFYDSSTKTLTWDLVNTNSLRQIRPGVKQSFNFAIRPDRAATTNPFVNLKIDVYGRRVAEANVAEEIIGSIERTIRVNSTANLMSSVAHGSSAFSDTGPVPPVVGQATSYTISLRAENSTNEISGTQVSGVLPLYVTWLDKTSGDGSFEYNQTNRTVTWLPGTIGANEDASASFQVSILPSSSQVGVRPELFSRQTLQATDVFTGQSITANSAAVNTELSRESGYAVNNGVVQSAQ
jgi:hypothetical protein